MPPRSPRETSRPRLDERQPKAPVRREVPAPSKTQVRRAILVGGLLALWFACLAAMVWLAMSG